MTAVYETRPLMPHAAPRWVACPGSVRLEALYPEDGSSEAAREGVAAHWALAEVLASRAVAEGQITPDNFVLTAEMVQAAEDVLRWIHARIAAHGGETPRLYSEQRVAIERVHGQCWGTLDLALYFPAAQVLYVADYKFGHGWVEVFENWQLLAYLAGLLQLFNLEGAVDPDLQVVLVIIQPRSYHPDGPLRTWPLTVEQSRPYVARLHAAAMQAMAPDTQCIVNVECTNCQARHACPALQERGLAAIDYSHEAVPFDLPPLALGLELAHVRSAIKALTARETGLAGQAEAILKGGGRVPFWGIASEPGRLAWTVTGAEVLALGTMLGMDLQKPVEPITPTQARDRGLEPGLLDVYATRPAGKAKLVPRDDATARKVFGHIDGAVNNT